MMNVHNLRIEDTNNVPLRVECTLQHARTHTHITILYEVISFVSRFSFRLL